MITFLKKRSAGILLHICSLPSPFGIGDLGPGAHRFIDYLQRAGQRFWQILPVNPTSGIFGNSPYMSFSAFAGNPLFISPELLVADKLLPAETLTDPGFSPYLVDYLTVTSHKIATLKSAWTFSGKSKKLNPKLREFRRQQPWVEEYALFMALRERYGQQAWNEWPNPLKTREPAALATARIELEERINYYCFEQFLFFMQWRQLHLAANKAGIQLIGDLPIYVGLDSVDVWSNQDIFELDEKTGQPSRIAGVPPDYFSKTGQRWGNPLYRWNSKKPAVRERLLGWWEARLRACFSLVDCVRLDHFRGFEAYWSIPAKEVTAVKGVWKKGPGLQFFREMEQRIGPLPIIAEDLGLITKEVEALRDALGFPGMKILLFAFDGDPENSYLLHNMAMNQVAYTGTHDNDTAVGWYLEAKAEARAQAKAYANRDDDDASRFHRDLIHCAMISPAALVILPMQDVLGFGNDCRMNTPATSQDNWRWRVADEFLSDASAAWLRRQTTMHGRFSN